MSANCQPFFFRVSFFSRISTVGSAHFLVVATCGFPVSGLMKVRRYSHSPDRKAGSSTPALLGAGAEVSAGAAAASGAGAVEAGAGVSGAPCAGSAPAAHSAASGASSRRTAARFSALRRGLRTGIEGSGSLVSEGQSIAERARRRSAASPRADNLGYGPPARYTRVKYTGGVDLGTTMYDMKAPKQTVSLTVNSDLYARAKKLGINASQIAEEALTQALARKLAEQIRAEIREDLAAYNSYIEAHGSPAEMARAHYRGRDDAV